MGRVAVVIHLLVESVTAARRILAGTGGVSCDFRLIAVFLIVFAFVVVAELGCFFGRLVNYDRHI